MYPILFQIGSFKIYSYGMMVAIGFLAAVYLTSREAAKRGITPEYIMDIYLAAMVAGVIGARILHAIVEIGYYREHPIDVIMINHGGLAFQGGLVCGIFAAWIVIKKRGLPLMKTADMMMPYVALGQSIGRIGCFLNGCCYGRPPHPTQIYLSVFFLAMFVVLKRADESKKRDGMVFAWYLLLFSAGSFFIDFFRGDLAVVFFGLRVSQLISSAIFAASLAAMGVLKWKNTHLR